MKKKWKWIYAILAVAVVVGALFALGLLKFPEANQEEQNTPATTTSTTASTTIATEPSDPVIPGTLSFTGKVLEINDGMALMECYDKDKFDTVLVNYSNTPSVTPQVGEEYFVEYEDFMMPSLPPRIFSVRMEKQNAFLSTGEPLYNDVVDAVMSAFPWGDVGAEIYTIPDYPEMSYMYGQCESLSDVGWFQVDLDGNGQKELLIGNTTSGTYPYDCFTIKDGKLVHLFSSGERDMFFVLENGYLRNEWSGSAVCSGVDYYRLVDGELQFVERITYDAIYAEETGVIADWQEANSDNCYFYTTIKNEGDQYEGYRSITAEEYQTIQEKYYDNQEIEITYHKLG